MTSLTTAEFACAELAEYVCVRNTFIDLANPMHSHSAHRRSHSAPVTRMPQVNLESITNQSSLSKTLPLVLPHPKPDSQASTDGCSETSENRFDTCCSEDVTTTPISTPRSQASLPWACGLQGEDGTGRHSTVSVIPPPPLVPWHSFTVESPISCCNARPGFTSLNPKAVPWQPTPAMAVPQAPFDFEEAVDAVVKSFVQEIEHCVSVPITVHIIRERRLWSIICRIREEDREHQDTILQHAKGHILCASQASDTLYLLGCHLDPFQPKQRGFGAVLVSMQDKNLACWDFYTTGKCARERKCRWQHPLSKHRLVVVIKNLTEFSTSSLTAAAT